MKNPSFIMLVLTLLFFSCKTEKKNNTNKTLNVIDLANSVYFLTSNFDSTNCKVYSACDCCSGNIIFLNEREFIAINYCEGDEEYFKGKYVILGTTLQLNFNSDHVLNEYNWEYELDTTGTIKNQFNIKKIKSNANPKRFEIFYCKDQVCLNGSVGEEGFYGTLDTLKVNNVVSSMKKDRIWQKL